MTVLIDFGVPGGMGVIGLNRVNDQHIVDPPADGDFVLEGSLDAAAYLRSRDMVVVHDRAGWSLVAYEL